MSDKTVFEYGAGYSSYFWAQRAREVFSVEKNPEWFEALNKFKVKNRQVFLAQKRADYVSSIQNPGKQFDVIIIDGWHRFYCAQTAIHFLREGGMMILDNSDWYPRTSQLLRDNDLIEVDFSGFGPINNYTWTTSIYLSRSFRFKSIHPNQPIFSIGSLHQNCDQIHEPHLASDPS